MRGFVELIRDAPLSLLRFAFRFAIQSHIPQPDLSGADCCLPGRIAQIAIFLANVCSGGSPCIR